MEAMEVTTSTMCLYLNTKQGHTRHTSSLKMGDHNTVEDAKAVPGSKHNYEELCLVQQIDQI